MRGGDVAVLVLAIGVLAALLDSNRRARARRHVEEGDRHLAAGRHLDALCEFDGALGLDAGARGAHAGRARSLHGLGRHRAALAAARRAAEASPGGADAHSLMAGIYLSMGRMDDAASSLEAAVRLDPSRLADHRSLCAILRERGRHEAACEAHERAGQLFPDDARLHYNHGLALEFLARERPAEAEGLRRRAVAAIRRAIELAPHDPEFGMALEHIEGRLRGEGGASG